MRKLLVTLLFMIIWTAATIAATLFGAFYNWSDYVHTDYGLPLTWATHTTSTFAGPANIWTVDTTALAADLAIWLIIMIVAVAAIQLVADRVKQPKPSTA